MIHLNKLRWTSWYKLTSPRDFTHLASSCIPWLMVLFLGFFSYGLYAGLYLAPADYQQGDGFRIIYMHVPSAFMSLLVYALLTVAALAHLVWRVKLANIFIDAAAPIGAAFTLLALVTGSLWGKPMWGTWWIWDARLTSELLLLFIYCGIIALKNAFPDPAQASFFKNVFVLIGSVNLPIIHFSVTWWNTLHQGSTLRLLGPSLMAPSMARPLVIMIFAFSFYFTWLSLVVMRNRVLSDYRRNRWVADYVALKGKKRGEVC